MNDKLHVDPVTALLAQRQRDRERLAATRDVMSVASQALSGIVMLNGNSGNMDQQCDSALRYANTIISKLHRDDNDIRKQIATCLEGTGCADILEMRKRLDWAMENYVKEHWNNREYRECLCGVYMDGQKPDPVHYNDCEYIKNYYEKRLK